MMLLVSTSAYSAPRLLDFHQNGCGEITIDTNSDTMVFNSERVTSMYSKHGMLGGEYLIIEMPGRTHKFKVDGPYTLAKILRDVCYKG